MENNKFIEGALTSFLTKTREKKIPWIIINPNALRWIKQSPNTQPITVTLQKQVNAAAVQPNTFSVTPSTSYVLTIQQPPNTAIQINSSMEPTMKEILSQLFQNATLIANDKTVEVINNL